MLCVKISWKLFAISSIYNYKKDSPLSIISHLKFSENFFLYADIPLYFFNLALKNKVWSIVGGKYLNFATVKIMRTKSMLFRSIFPINWLRFQSVPNYFFTSHIKKSIFNGILLLLQDIKLQIFWKCFCSSCICPPHSTKGYGSQSTKQGVCNKNRPKLSVGCIKMKFEENLKCSSFYKPQ